MTGAQVEREPKDPSRIIAPIDYNPHLPKASLIFFKNTTKQCFLMPLILQKFSNPQPCQHTGSLIIFENCSVSQNCTHRTGLSKWRGVHIRKPLAGRNVGNPAKYAPLQWKIQHQWQELHQDTTIKSNKQSLVIQQIVSIFGSASNQIVQISPAANTLEWQREHLKIYSV